jgi:hypothetical protein
LTLKYDEPLSNFAFNFNLRRYTTCYPLDTLKSQMSVRGGLKVGRCRLTLSNPR